MTFDILNINRSHLSTVPIQPTTVGPYLPLPSDHRALLNTVPVNSCIIDDMIRRLGCTEKRCPATLLFKRVVHQKNDAITTSRAKGQRAATRNVSFSTNTSNEIVNLLPPRFLRDADVANYDAVTQQRNDVPFDVDNCKPLPTKQEEAKYVIRDCSVHDDSYTIEWEDGHTSLYSASWVKDTVDRWKGEENEMTPRILWSNLTEIELRNDPSLSLPFRDLLEESGMKVALKALYQYGFVLITETPLDDDGAGIAALASAVSGGAVKVIASNSLLANYRAGSREIMLPHGTDGPLRTLYGSVWSTTSSGQADGASVADSAYGKGGLPLHTDMTYHRDPPGLQIFTMVQPALQGGESVFADGFAAADFLKLHHPGPFSTLSSVIRTYRCIDKATGWYLEARGPVISTLDNGVVNAIRHNDLDRLPDLPPFGSTPQEAELFYEKLSDAHDKWNEVLTRDEFRLVMSLNPGDTAVVANQVSDCGANSFLLQSRIRSQLPLFVPSE